MIANNTISAITDRADIVEVIQDFVKLKREGSDYVALCPFHDEKTPSFKISPAKHIYKCFGCGKSGNAITFVMEHEKINYIDALKYLAGKYKIEVEEFTTERKEFEKPVARLEKLSKPLIAWFEDKRKISNNTLLRFKITEAVEWMPKAKKEILAVCFNYFRNDELVNIKYRATGKDFKMVKDAELIFYNLDAIKEENECVIVEGEIDCLSLYEAGVYNCVSVPNGAATGNQRLEYLDNCYEWFASKSKVIIMTDNDGPGNMLRDELARRLGYDKCFTVTYPESCKDANDVLVRFGKDAIKNCIDNATEWPIQGIFTAVDFVDDILGFYKNGYPHGYPIEMEGFKGRLELMLGQFTTVTGIPGSGKSELIDAIMVAMAKAHQWTWAVLSSETQPVSLHITKLMQKYVGKAFPKRDNAFERIQPNEIPEAIDFINNYFYFINIREVELTLAAILEKVKELILRRGVKGIVLDPYNRIHHIRQNGQNETDYANWFLTEITNFCQQNGVHIILVAHPTKLKKEKNGKYEVPTMYSISGSAHFFNQTDNGISVYRDFETGIVDVYIQKVRFEWLGNIGFFSYRYDKSTRQYILLDKDKGKDKIPPTSQFVPLAINFSEPASANDDATEDDKSDDLPF